MVIDSKTYQISINFECIEYLGENKDGKLNIVYYLPSNDNNAANFQKKNETYECCENEEMIKVFKNIRNQIEMDTGRQNRVT